MSEHLILQGDFVVVSAAEAPILHGGVLCEGGKVVAVGPSDDLVRRHPDAAIVGGKGDVVIPGLIDAHQHGRGISNIQRGIPDGFLEQWLTRLRGLWPVDPYRATALAATRLLRSGVTTAMHHFASGGVLPLREEMIACLRAYRDVGLRVTFTFDFRDRFSYVYADDDAFLASLPETLSRRLRARLPSRVLPMPAESRDFIKEIRAEFESPTIRFALGPQGSDWASDALLAGLADLAQSEALPLHTHMLETSLQAQASAAVHGVTAVQRLKAFGLLGNNTSLAHMVWVDQADLDTLHDTGTAIVHNPASNLRLRSGIAPVPALLARDIAVGIGMDGMSLSDRSNFFEDLRLCAALHFETSGDGIGADPVWRMLYAGGAKATFWGDHIGNLRPGSFADAVVVSLPQSGSAAPLDPSWRVLDRVLREGEPGMIKATVVAGRAVFANGSIATVDDSALMESVLAEAIDEHALGERRSLVKELEDAVVGYYRAPHWRRGGPDLNNFGNRRA